MKKSSLQNFDAVDGGTSRRTVQMEEPGMSSSCRSVFYPPPPRGSTTLVRVFCSV